jgi:hypothetical protein
LQSILSQPHGDIFISADGPRQEYPNECLESHALIKSFASTGIIKNYRLSESNIGLMDSMHIGIDWFFSLVPEGLIIEDDLILHSPILAEAELYFECLRFNPEVGSISLTNSVPISKLKFPANNIRLASTFDSHGWGTTAQRWSQNSKTFLSNSRWFPWIKMVPHLGLGKTLHIYLDLKKDRKNEATNPKKCSFAWRWAITHYMHDWKIIIPTINRIGYEGLGKSATNTFMLDYPSPKPDFETPQVKSIERVEEDSRADRYFYVFYGWFELLKNIVALRTRYRRILQKIRG